MISKKKYIYDNLRNIGIEDSVIKKIYTKKISCRDVDVITSSNYPLYMIDLMLNDKFRNYSNKLAKDSVIAIINDCEEDFQASYCSKVATDDVILDNKKLPVAVLYVSLAKDKESARVTSEIVRDSEIIDCNYWGLLANMAVNGVKKDKIYEIFNSFRAYDKTNNKTLNLDKN